VTIAKRPSCGQGRRKNAIDLPFWKSEIFLILGLDMLLKIRSALRRANFSHAGGAIALAREATRRGRKSMSAFPLLLEEMAPSRSSLIL